jgi:AcrR family transcriptional regulator
VGRRITLTPVATQQERTAAATTAVLDAADQLFGADGFLATSVKRIAEVAGVSKSGLLHHFGSKEEIFRQVFIRAEQELVELSVRGIIDATQQLIVGARNLIDALNDPRLRQIALVDGPAVLGWAQWRHIEAEYGVSIIVAVLEQAASAGELAVEPSASVAGMLLAALHEASFALIDEPGQRTAVEQTLRRMIDALFLDDAPTTTSRRKPTTT